MFSETLHFQRLLQFTALLLCPLLAGGMSGCTSQPPSSGPQEIQSVAAPSPENIFRIPLMTNPPDLDPILVSDTTSSGVATKLFTSLYDYTPELELEPCLAKEMPTISEDGRVYDIQLRDDVRFTNGRTVTAADMKYSIQRLASVRSKRTNLVEKIVGAKEVIAGASKSQEVSPEIPGIEVLGDHSLRITLIESSPPFVNKLAMVNTAAVPREVIEEIGDKFSRNPVGSGPFTLAEWKEGVSLKLTANQDYFEGAPKLAGIHYRVIPEPLAQLEEYKAGNFDILAATQGVYPKWKNSNRANEVLFWPSLAVQYYGFNLKKEGSPYAGYSDSARKLREAVNLAVDRKFLGEILLEGRSYPANGILPPGIFGHNSERPAFTQDVEKAKALLAEAGYPNGEGLPPVDLWFNTQGDNSKIAQAVQADLKKVGIEIGLKMLDWAAFIEATDAGEPPFFRLGWVASYPDAEYFLASLFHTKNQGSQGNVSFYSNPEVDKLIDDSYAETDPAKRVELLKQAESRIIADSPWLFLLFGQETVLLKPYVRNYNPTGMCDDVQGNYVRWHLVEIDAGNQG